MGQKHILFVTSYPPKGAIHSDKTVGVASYSRLLTRAITVHNHDLKITVLAEKLGKQEQYSEDGVEVRRMWRRKSWTSIYRLWVYLAQSKVKTILVAYEGYMLGGIGQGLAFLVGLAILRLTGKEIFLILHQVPTTDANLGLGGVTRLFQPVGVSLFKRIVASAANKVVVFEKYLAKNLGGDKAVVIPHVLPKSQGIKKVEARKRLGWDKHKKYALIFGYIAPYKGIERIIDNWKNHEIRLVVAGGINPNHKNNQKVLGCVERVKKSAKRKGVIVTGFVPEELLESYFAACDVVIVPYRTMFSSSGPLSWALAYEKPIVMSQELKPYMQSDDFAEGMKQARLVPSNIFVDVDQEISMVIEEAGLSGDKWERFGQFMKENRSMKKVRQSLLHIIGELS